MFRVTTTYDHRALKAINRAVRKTVRRYLSLLMRIFGVLFVAMEVVLFILLSWLGAFLWDAYTVIMILAGAAVIALIVWGDDLSAWIGGRMTYQYKASAETVFEESGYIVRIEGLESRWTYEKIMKFCETKDAFVFLLDKNHGQVFPKDGFTEGTPDDFRAFIMGHSGRPALLV